MKLLLLADSDPRPWRRCRASVEVFDEGNLRRVEGNLLVVYDGEAYIEDDDGQVWRGEVSALKTLKGS